MPDERDRDEELARLRAEVDRLTSARRRRSRRRRSRQRWRTALASALIALGCVLAPVAVVAVWVHNQVADTDRYVDTVTPLASDPAVQAAATDRITTAIVTGLDVENLTAQVLRDLADLARRPVVAERLTGLAGPLSSGVESFIHDQVSRVVHSDRFVQAWVTANRVTHDRLDRILTGNAPNLTEDNGDVVVDLSGIIDDVKDRLADEGLGVVSRIPDVHATVALMSAQDLDRAQRGYRALDRLAWVLPVGCLLLVAAGVGVARGHRRALVGAGLGLAAAMLALAVGLVIGRAVYLGSLPASVSQDAATSVYDIVVRYLRTALRALLVLGLVVAGGAFLTGQSPAAVRTRASVQSALDSLRRRGEAAGVHAGPVGTWVYAHRTALRVAAVCGTVLVFVFWDRPTGMVILVLSLILLLLLAVIEFVARPAAGTP